MSNFRKSIRKYLDEKPVPPKANAQSLALATLNLMQVLEDNAPKYLQNWLNYGPATLIGQGWAAYLVWYREKGYDKYQDLWLFGVWAKQEDDNIALLVGTKPLKFTAPVFNAESYNTIIKTNFKVYYDDPGDAPTEDDVHFRAVYDESRRLALRHEVADAIIQVLRQKA